MDGLESENSLLENLTFDMGAAVGWEFVIDVDTFVQSQNETAMTNGEIQNQTNDSGLGLPGEAGSAVQGDLDDFWGLDGNLAAELDLMFPDPVSAQQEGSQIRRSDNFLEDFNVDFDLDDHVPSDFQFQPDTADTDMMMTAPHILA